MYIDKASRWQIVAIYGAALFFLVLAVLAFFSSGVISSDEPSNQSDAVASLFFLLLAIMFSIYALHVSVHEVIFDPSLPDIQIKRLFRKTITISPRDCIRVATTGGYTSLSKLIFMNGGKKDSVVIISTSFKVTQAWTQYTHRWLSSLKTKRVIDGEKEVDRILASTSEEDFEQHKNQ